MGDGCIIRMTDKEYIEKLIPEIEFEAYTRVIISNRIRLDRDYPNTLRLKNIFPPPYCTSMVIAADTCTDEYLEAYTNYLTKPENMTLLSILVSSVIKKNGRLVLICTKDEKDFRHLEIICNLIEDIFELKCYSYKQFLKLKEISIPNRSRVMDRLNDVLEELNKIDLEKKHEEKIIRRKVKEDLEEQTWEYLYSFCKKRNIKAKKKYSKDKLIKNILKADERSELNDGPTDDDDDDDGMFHVNHKGWQKI
jgi:hypothetical protein